MLQSIEVQHSMCVTIYCGSTLNSVLQSTEVQHSIGIHSDTQLVPYFPVMAQSALQNFQEELGKAMKDPYKESAVVSLFEAGCI